MSTLDFVTLGYLGFAVIQGKKATNANEDIVEEAVMGTLGGVVGALVAGLLFGVGIPFANILFAAVGLLVIVGISKISKLKSKPMGVGPWSLVGGR